MEVYLAHRHQGMLDNFFCHVDTEGGLKLHMVHGHIGGVDIYLTRGQKKGGQFYLAHGQSGGGETFI